MAKKTDAELLVDAAVIRDETEKHANTATRVGEMLVNIIENKPNYNGSISAMVDCGAWDVSGNLFPSGVGTGASGAIEKGNEFTLVGNGTLGESEIEEVQKLNARALYDTPGQDESKWKIY